jgi:tRNA(fMet)-specific endonuclease VapC
MFIYKYGILLNMSRSVQTSSSIRRLSGYIRRAIRPKRIVDVVGLRILADEDWKETRAELKKISKDTLSRLEKSY